jgi:hypothetical protein
LGSWRQAVLAAFFLVPAPATAAELLPRLTLHLEGLRYQPTQVDVHWAGTFGGGATLVAAGPVALRVQGDVETIIGNSRRAFDATQANYHLEASLWRRFGSAEAGLVFAHVSRHVQDRPKEAAVDWNVLRVQAMRSFERGFVEGGVGHTTLASQVGYGWELVARGDTRLLRLSSTTTLYGLFALRAVEAEASAAFDRGSFADVKLESGVRFTREDRRLDVFAAWQRRHDIPVDRPGRADRLLLGFRLGNAGPDGLGSF